MAHKYVSLEQAATMLGLSTDEVNDLRESGELRGFADRGTWKFRMDTIEEMMRSRSFGSDPDMPIFEETVIVTPDADEPAAGDDPDATRKTAIPAAESDDDAFFELVDSDVDMLDSFAGGSTNTPPPALSVDDSEATMDFLVDDEPSDDSTAKHPRPDVGDPDATAKNVVPAAEANDSARFELAGEDSGIFAGGADDSGINLVPDDDLSGIALDAGATSGITLEEESGISLDDGESDITLDFDGENESGIALDLGGDDASGIALDLGGESGIALDMGEESGIALDFDTGESGIGLDFATDSNVVVGSSPGATDRMPLGEVEETVDYKSDDLLDAPHTADVPVRAESDFDLGADEVDVDEFDEDAFDAADELEEVDEFDDAGDPFDDDDLEAGFDEDEAFDEDDFEDDLAPPIPGAARGRKREASWGAVTAVGLVLCVCVMAATMLVTWQSMVGLWSGETDPDSILTTVVDSIAGIIP